jgi:hypothetical protein
MDPAVQLTAIYATDNNADAGEGETRPLPSKHPPLQPHGSHRPKRRVRPTWRLGTPRPNWGQRPTRILTPVPPEDPVPWMAAVELHKPATANLPKDPSSRKTSVPLTSLHSTALLRPLTTGWKRAISITFMVLGLHLLKHLDASLPLISLTLPLLGGQDSHNQNTMIKLRNGLS